MTLDELKEKGYQFEMSATAYKVTHYPKQIVTQMLDTRTGGKHDDFIDALRGLFTLGQATMKVVWDEHQITIHPRVICRGKVMPDRDTWKKKRRVPVNYTTEEQLKRITEFCIEQATVDFVMQRLLGKIE